MANNDYYFSDICFDICTRVGLSTGKSVCKRAEDKLSHYAFNILAAMGYPDRKSAQYETVINGIANSAIHAYTEGV